MVKMKRKFLEAALRRGLPILPAIGGLLAALMIYYKLTSSHADTMTYTLLFAGYIVIVWFLRDCKTKEEAIQHIIDYFYDEDELY